MKMRKISPWMQLPAVALALGVWAHAADAMMIDFETMPGGGTATESVAISDQFRSTFGVRFLMEGGGVPLLAQVGGAMTAFGGGIENVPDMPLPGQGVGDFFLTDDGSVAAPPRPLWIGYDTPVAGASGVILDVDFWGRSTTIYESWSIDAFDIHGQYLDTIEISAGDPGAGDGVASTWSFERPTADIRMIRVTYTGTKDFGVGLAFDNFSPSEPARGPATPEPGAAALFALGLAVATRRARVRR